jgi:predicted phosphodiesterase
MWIGILADSHGNEKATERAAAALLERGATCLIHLGDLCESMEGKVTEGMLALALRHGITVIKGNNDWRGAAAGRESIPRPEEDPSRIS